MRRTLHLWSIVIACSSCISYCFYFRVHREAQLPALDYALESTEYNDIIFIGSSRVRVQIDPAVIDSITGMRSHSLALDGATMVIFHMLLEAYLHHHPSPRLAILNIDINAFVTDQDVYNFPDYFPYLKDPVVRASLAPFSVVYRSQALQGFYAALKLISLTDNDKINLFLRYGAPADESIQAGSGGFAPVFREWSPRAEEEPRRQYVQHTTEEGFQLLEVFSRACFERGIQLLFIYTPEYIQTKETALNYDRIIDTVKAIGARYEAPFYDYSNMPQTASKSYFYNGHHLNRKGAAVYSSVLGHDIAGMLDRQRATLSGRNP